MVCYLHAAPRRKTVEHGVIHPRALQSDSESSVVLTCISLHRSTIGFTDTVIIKNLTDVIHHTSTGNRQRSKLVLALYSILLPRESSNWSSLKELKE